MTVYRLLHIMMAWIIAGSSEAKLCVARDPFNDDVLRIVMSEFDTIRKEYIRDINL